MGPLMKRCILSSVTFLFLCLFSLTCLANQESSSGFSDNTKSIRIGKNTFPKYTEEEIDKMPFKEVQALQLGYVLAYYKVHVATFIKTTGLTENPFPPEVFMKISGELGGTSEAEAREKAKDFYRPGGIERINKELYVVVERHLREYMAKNNEQVALQNTNSSPVEESVPRDTTPTVMSTASSGASFLEEQLEKIMEKPMLVMIGLCVFAILAKIVFFGKK